MKWVLVLMELVSGYLVLEEVADNRSYDTWQERVQAAVKRVGLGLRYLVSDRIFSISEGTAKINGLRTCLNGTLEIWIFSTC